MVVHENPRPPSHSHLVHRNLAHVPLGAVQAISIPNHDGHCNDAIDDCAPLIELPCGRDGQSCRDGTGADSRAFTSGTGSRPQATDDR